MNWSNWSGRRDEPAEPSRFATAGGKGFDGESGGRGNDGGELILAWNVSVVGDVQVVI